MAKSSSGDKVRVLAVRAEKIYHSFLPCEVCHLKSVSLQKLFLQRSTKPSPFDPTVHHKPCLLVYLYVESHLELYAKHCLPFQPYLMNTQSSQGAVVSPVESPIHSVPAISDSVYMSLSLLHSLAALVRSIPGVQGSVAGPDDA